jgi:hypothetical protein
MGSDDVLPPPLGDNEAGFREHGNDFAPVKASPWVFVAEDLGTAETPAQGKAGISWGGGVFAGRPLIHRTPMPSVAMVIAEDNICGGAAVGSVVELEWKSRLMHDDRSWVHGEKRAHQRRSTTRRPEDEKPPHWISTLPSPRSRTTQNEYPAGSPHAITLSGKTWATTCAMKSALPSQ